MVAVAILCSATSTFAADTIHLATDARSIRQGEVVVFSATTSQPVDAMRARAFDRDLATFRLDATRWQTLVGVDVDTKPGSYTVSFEATSAGQTITAAAELTVMSGKFGTRSPCK